MLFIKGIFLYLSNCTVLSQRSKNTNAYLFCMLVLNIDRSTLKPSKLKIILISSHFFLYINLQEKLTKVTFKL